MLGRRLFIFFFFIALPLAAAGAGGYWWYEVRDASVATAAAAYKTPEEKDVYVRFDMELYDVIQKEYWQKAVDAELAELYKLALQKVEGTTTAALKTSDRVGVAVMLSEAIARTPEDKRKAVAVDTAIVVLANLAPQGRNNLLTEKTEQEFRDLANNVDRSQDLYKTLGVAENAPVEEVKKAFEEKKEELEAVGTPEAKAELEKVEHAHTVLSDDSTKAVYDQTKIQPTVASRVIGKSVLYLDISKVSNATFQEFANTLERTKDQPELTSLIIDLRGNIGGSLDFAKFLLSLFMGPQQFALDLYHQGELTPERTPAIAALPGLKRMKDIAILTDGATGSTSEATTAMFKRFRLGKVVGTRTKGWGSVENTFPLETHFNDGNKYKALLVHSLMLREDNEPIEGRGVDPDIDVNNPNWRAQLRQVFDSTALINAVAAEIDRAR